MIEYEDYLVIAPLSDAKICQLIEDYRLGNMEAYQQLIFSNIPLIKYLIKKKFPKYPYSKEDLYSAGKYGLMKAIETFSREKGVKFVTYASNCIVNSMTNFAHKEAKTKSLLVSLDSYLREETYDEYDAKGNDVFSIRDEKIYTLNSEVEEDIGGADIIKYATVIVEEIPYKRNRDILKEYLGIGSTPKSKSELSVDYKLSLASISRIIASGLSYLTYRLESIGLIELSEKEREVEKKRADSLLEYLDCSEEELKIVFDRLSPSEQELLMEKHGKDLKSYNQGRFTSQSKDRRYYYLIKKCREILRLIRLNENQNEDDSIDSSRSLMEAEGIIIQKVLVKKR